MNNKIVAGIVVAIIVLGGGYFIIRGRSANNNEVASNSQTAQTQNQAEVKSSTESGSFKSLLASGTTRKCTYKNTQDSYSGGGTIYVDGGKMRADINATVAGKTTMTHMISKDSVSYMWTEGTNVAFKMPFDPNAAKPTDASASQKFAVDLEKNYDFSCESWSGDSAMFELPAGVTFSEMPSVPAMKAEVGAKADANNSMDSKAGAQLVCNSLSGTAKDQCLKAIK